MLCQGRFQCVRSTSYSSTEEELCQQLCSWVSSTSCFREATGTCGGKHFCSAVSHLEFFNFFVSEFIPVMHLCYMRIPQPTRTLWQVCSENYAAINYSNKWASYIWPVVVQHWDTGSEQAHPGSEQEIFIYVFCNIEENINNSWILDAKVLFLCSVVIKKLTQENLIELRYGNIIGTKKYGCCYFQEPFISSLFGRCFIVRRVRF